MLIATDDPQTTTASDPELLIEEARERQRQRLRRRAALIAGVVLLAAVLFGIARLALGGSSVRATPPPPRAVGVGVSTPAVIYEKVEVETIAAHRPTTTSTYESWIASDAPINWETTIPGRPTLAFGQDPVIDPLIGREDALDLYDAQTKTIYRMGANLPPQQLPTTPAQAFHRLLARPGLHLAGTRTYDGRNVYVVRWSGSTAQGGPGLPTPSRFVSSFYIDKQSYVPVVFETIVSGPGGVVRTILRALNWRTLPDTSSNGTLARLARRYPGARILRQRPIREHGSVYTTAFAAQPAARDRRGHSRSTGSSSTRSPWGRATQHSPFLGGLCPYAPMRSPLAAVVYPAPGLAWSAGAAAAGTR